MAQTPNEDCHNQTLKLDDGRILGYAEYGSRTSQHVIVYLHGLPASRFEAALLDSTATKLNIRIVAPDRPGLGLSTRKADRKTIDYPKDVAQLASYLELENYVILGVSGGGMYALACAAQTTSLPLPGLRGIGIVAALGPRDITQQGMSLYQRLAFLSMDFVPKSVVSWIWDLLVGKAARDRDPSLLANSVKKALKAVTGPDADIYKDDVVVDAFIASLRGAFAQGSNGYADEAALVAQPWGFDLEDVKDVAVRLWYGEKDELAPAAVGRALAQRIDGAQCTVFDDLAHTGTILRHLVEVLGTCREMLAE